MQSFCFECGTELDDVDAACARCMPGWAVSIVQRRLDALTDPHSAVAAQLRAVIRDLENDQAAPPTDSKGGAP